MSLRHRILSPLSDVKALLAQPSILSSVERDRETLLNLIDQIDAHRESLESPLRILLVGGTGVGKSTLLNAIAGKSIATVSPRRPTTDRLTVYHHRGNPTTSIGSLERFAQIVAHDHPGLRNKLLVDAPDFDSTVKVHRQRLLEALSVSDLVLCLVTAEKYLSRELFSLLADHRKGLSFVFILNKIDLAPGGAQAICDDLRSELDQAGFPDARILAVSAEAAYEARHRGKPPGETAGQFGELLTILEEELDRVRIREIKTANLEDRTGRLIDRLKRLIPEDFDAACRAWREDLHDTIADLTDELTDKTCRLLRREPAIGEAIRFSLGTSFRWIFGMFAGLAYGLRSLLRPGAGRGASLTTTDLERLLREGADLEPALVRSRAQTVLQRFAEHGRRIGVEPAYLEEALTETEARTNGLLGAFWRRGAQELRQALTRIRNGWGAGPNLLLNLGPLAFVGWVGYRYVRDYLAGEFLGTDYLVHSLVILVLICFAEWLLVEAVIGRSTRRTLSELDGVVGRAMEETVRGVLTEEPERIIDTVEARSREIKTLD